MVKMNWPNDFYSHMFFLDFDCLFSTVDLKVSRILFLTQLIGNRTSFRTIQR